MKYFPLASAFVLCLSLNSCKEELLIPEKNEFSKENYFDYGGDEMAPCMIQAGDTNVLFAQLGGGNYALIGIDVEGNEKWKIAINSAYPNFEAEEMYFVDNTNFLIVGALDNHPAWVILDSDASGGFFPQTWNNDIGRFYSAQIRADHILLAGQKDVDGDRQVFLSKIGKDGSPLDSLSFGTTSQDGGIKLLSSQDKTLLLAYSYGKGLGDRDFWLMEIDAQMNPSNEKVFGGAGYDQPEWMIEAYGAIYLCGHTTSFGDPMHDAYLICLENDLSLRWEKNIHMDGHEGADHLIDLGNNKLAFCSYGSMDLTGGYYGIVDANGLVLDQKKYPVFERFYQLRAYPDRLMILNQKKIVTKDIGVWVKSY
ncbi:MAG TPA: hypothetical protein DIW47_14640 [Bacteroidetes bacterium]|nr:hypothetical protein [Bacteroidota bacterium]